MAHHLIIPAAGKGTRFGSSTPKQYQRLGSKYLIDVTIDRLIEMIAFDSVSVGLSPDDRWWQERADITRVEGGASRAHSVLALLQSLAGIATESDWIWVHDAVRPCFSKTLVDSIHNALDDNAGAIIPGLPVTDTLKKVDREGRVQGTLDREGVYSVQTPQVCRYGLLLDALQQAMKKQAAVTDESMAMELAGHPVVLLRGDENNIKVTRPGDLIRVNEILCGVQAI